MESSATDAAVIQSSIGDPERFGLVFDRHVAPVYAYLARRCGRDGADGLVGEVFRVAFDVRARYRPDQPSALPWLYGIAANVLRQHRRTEYRQARVAEKLATLRAVGEDEGGMHEAVDSREDAATVMEAVAALPAGERDAILLLAWEELSYAEIAEALDVPVGTVRSRLNRARSRVRERIGAGGQEQAEPTRRADRRCLP